ncbi:MAG TPA: FAD-dependent monooxygenase [Polyangiales bacterium]|nr:FAD-dependent monooxygenase [Polyangiales bacterium]
MTRHAIIVGGGIAGPLTALGLCRAGFHATIYEAYPEGSGEGAGTWFGVAVNGLSAMRALGVEDAVKAVGFRSELVELSSGTGKHLGTLPIGGTRSDGTTTHTMKRADLCRALTRSAREAGVRFEYGKRFASAAVTGRGVEARFDDGTSAHGDFLVGADGVHSRVRRAIDPNAPARRFTGLGNIGGFAPSASEALPLGRFHMIFGKRAFFGYTPAPNGEVWWFANPGHAHELTREELAATDWRAHLLDLFADDRGPMLDLIERTPGALMNANQYDLATVPRWHYRRLLILGDAAHAASPSSGQGVSMAAEDAVTLASCMREHDDVEAALAAFVAARRARVERVVAYGRRYANMKAPGPIGRFFRDLMLPSIFRLQARTYAASLRWLYEHPVLTPDRQTAFR